MLLYLDIEEVFLPEPGNTVVYTGEGTCPEIGGHGILYGA